MKQTAMISIAFCSGLVILLFAFSLVAGTAVSDVVKMENPAYKEHTKAIVQFNHKAHANKFDGKYPEIFEDGCGECHHDDRGEPRRELKMGDEVLNCIDHIPTNLMKALTIDTSTG
jgi:hypothetical protein